MKYPDQIAKLLTEDPDVFNNTVVIAVHPNYVVDAVHAAGDERNAQHETFGPKRLKMLKNYIERFKRFILGQQASGSTIIVTLMGDPYQLNSWDDDVKHWNKSNVVKSGMEQEEVLQHHQDLIDFIYELASHDNVIVLPEESAGDICRSGKLDYLLDDASEIQIIGGNLTGCLKATVKSLSRDKEGPSVSIIKELTFDDDENFWGRIS